MIMSAQPERRTKEKEEETSSDSAGRRDSQKTGQRQGNIQTNTGLRSSRSSSHTIVASEDNERNSEVSGVRADLEKGRDVKIVTWYSDKDPEVSFIL
jgi:hypothetical protein